MCGEEGFVMLHVIEDSLMDSVRLIPFLFLTYLAMRSEEHTSELQSPS